MLKNKIHKLNGRYARAFTDVSGSAAEILKDLRIKAKELGVTKAAVCVDDSLIAIMDKMDGKETFSRDTSSLLKIWLYSVANAGTKNGVAGYATTLYPKKEVVTKYMTTISIDTLTVTVKAILQDDTFHLIFSDTSSYQA
jgi:hypothetical protein